MKTRGFTLVAFSFSALLLFSGCATGMHGTFVSNSYIDSTQPSKGELLGDVSGRSEQTFFLYVFPIGESPSTHRAMEDAKAKIPGTTYLSNVSIDDREYWGVGYKTKAIEVDAEARN